MIITLNTWIEREIAHVSAQTGEREVALMSIEQGAYYGLNEVASRIWELIEHPRSVASICVALRDEYEVEPQVCEREVVSCLQTLATEGLIRIVDE